MMSHRLRPLCLLFCILLGVGCAAESRSDAETDAVEAQRASPPQPRGDWEWLQGFEEDTENWFEHREGTIHRVPSAHRSGYADGVESASGPHHARLRNPQGAGCVPPFAADTRCGGPYSPLGREPVPNADWPEGGYVTRIDIYLDHGWAAENPDHRFDFSSAINRAGDGAHHRDFLFNVGTDPAGTGNWLIGASLAHGRGNADPANPCPDPSDGRNGCRTPVRVEASGWYTFQHTFRDDGGDLAVDMEVVDPAGAVVAAWTIFDIQMDGVGGEHYGWFANQEVFDLAVDNAGKYLRQRPPEGAGGE